MAGFYAARVIVQGQPYSPTQGIIESLEHAKAMAVSLDPSLKDAIAYLNGTDVEFNLPVGIKG